MLPVAVCKYQFSAFNLGMHHIGPPDEGSYEHILGPLVNVLGLSDVLDHAVFHNGDPVADSHSLFLVMGYVHGGNAHALLGMADNRPHLHTELGIQVGQGLIHQKHVWCNDKRPGQGNPLLLPAGQLARHALRILHNLHQV